MATPNKWKDPVRLKILAEEIQKSPDNLTRAFDNIAKRLNISSNSVSVAWYGSLRHKINAFELQTSDGAVANVKNTPRVTSDQPVYEKLVSSKVYDGIRVETIKRYYAV